MKSNGVHKRLKAVFTGLSRMFGRLKWWGGSSYADPRLSDPYTRKRTRLGTKVRRKGKKRLQVPPCVPGTITYQDWLVRELGYDRRLADGYLFAYQNGYKVKMPMPSDLLSQI